MVTLSIQYVSRPLSLSENAKQREELTSIVGVNTRNNTTVGDMNVGECASTLVLGSAVSAGSVHFSKGVGEEVLDGDGSTSVVLQDLVRGGLGSSTVDVGGTRGLLEGCGILANVSPPDVVEGTRAEAVNSLAVVGANDDVREDSTGLENEDGISIATFLLAVAGVIFVGLAGVEKDLEVEGGRTNQNGRTSSCLHRTSHQRRWSLQLRERWYHCWLGRWFVKRC
jgi:hypothetical protein